MRFEHDNDEDIRREIESEIDSVVEELSPLTGSQEKWEYSAKKSKEMLRTISPLIDNIKDSASSEIDDLSTKIEDLQRIVEELSEENKELGKAVEDLKMRIEQPGKWHGKKFGL